MPDGTENIPFTILCDDWRYFCLENVPQFLDGFPNDGSCMVDTETKKVMDYNVTDTAKRYFGKLNEEFHKGIMDPGAFNATYNQYLDKLSTGAVLGMVDQWWQFLLCNRSCIQKNRIWHSLVVIMSLFLSRLMMVFTTDGIQTGWQK